jgi:hypothetical protein
MLGQGEGEPDGERFDGCKAAVNIPGQNRRIKHKEGDVILPLIRVLVNGCDRHTSAVNKTDARQILTTEQSGLQESKDGSSFGPGDTVIDVEMVGKGGSEVGDVDRWVKGAQLIEKEVERHRFVGDEGMDAWSDEGLDRDGGRAMANDDGSVLGVV